MATNPGILLQGQSVQNPLELYGRALALKNALGQGQLQQQEIQQNQQAMDRVKALNQAYAGSLRQTSEGKVEIDPDKLTQALSASGQGSQIPTVLKGIQDYQKSSADLSEAQSKAAALQQDAGGQLAATVKAAGDDPFLFGTLMQHAIASKHVDPTKVQPYLQQVQQALQQDPSGASAKAIVSKITDQLIAGSPEQKKLQTEAQNAASSKLNADTAASRQTIEAPGQKADADRKVFELKLLQGADNGGGEQAIFNRFSANPPALAKALLAWRQNLPAGVAKATEEVNKVYDNEIGAASKIAAETGPKVAQEKALVPVKAAQAGAEAAATEPIRARANADAQAYLMKQVGGPLQNVMDPGERSRISSEYLKANDVYAEKAADAERLKQFVAAARSGNQSAAGLMTISELRSVVNRVNTKELQQAGGGSIVRTITNGLDKAGSGIPSEDTLKELEKVADLNEKTAAGGFAQKVRGIKAVSPKANLSETPIAAPAAVDSSGGWKVIGVK